MMRRNYDLSRSEEWDNHIFLTKRPANSQPTLLTTNNRVLVYHYYLTMRHRLHNIFCWREEPLRTDAHGSFYYNYNQKVSIIHRFNPTYSLNCQLPPQAWLSTWKEQMADGIKEATNANRMHKCHCRTKLYAEQRQIKIMRYLRRLKQTVMDNLEAVKTYDKNIFRSRITKYNGC